MEKEEVILPPINEEDWMWSGLCYPFWFIFSPWTLKTNKKDDLFRYFHALQGLHFGIFTSVSSLISFIIVYFIFFRPNIEQLSNATTEQLGSRMMCGTVAVVILFLFLMYITIILFMSLYFGWRAASGKMFRIPFIGKFAWKTVYSQKEKVESEYYHSTLGQIELKARQRGIHEPEPEDEILPEMPVQPVEEKGKAVPRKKDGEVDYEALMIQMPPIDKIKSIFAPQEEIPVEEEEFVEAPPMEEERQLSPLEKLALLRRQHAETLEPEETIEEDYIEEEQQEIIEEEPSLPYTGGEPGREETPLLFREDIQNLSPEEQIAMLRKQQELEKQKQEAAVVSQEEPEEIPVEPKQQVPAPAKTSYLDPKEVFFRIQQQRLGMAPQKGDREPSEELIETVSSAPPIKHMSPLEQLSMMQKQQKERQAQLSFTPPEEEEIETRHIPKAQPTSRLDPGMLFMRSQKEMEQPEPPPVKKASLPGAGKKLPDDLSPLEKLSILRKKQKKAEEIWEDTLSSQTPKPLPTSRLDPSTLLWGNPAKKATPSKAGPSTPVTDTGGRQLSPLEKLAKLREKKEKTQKDSVPSGKRKPVKIQTEDKSLSPLEQLAARQKEREKEIQQHKEERVTSVQERSRKMRELLEKMKDRTRPQGGRILDADENEVEDA